MLGWRTVGTKMILTKYRMPNNNMFGPVYYQKMTCGENKHDFSPIDIALVIGILLLLSMIKVSYEAFNNDIAYLPVNIEGLRMPRLS
jgi:hypothetical protein